MNVIEMPLIGGFMMLMKDKSDIRKELSIGILALVGIVILAEAFNLPIGETGRAMLPAFTILLGYWFGVKEAEIKQSYIGNKARPA